MLLRIDVTKTHFIHSYGLIHLISIHTFGLFDFFSFSQDFFLGHDSLLNTFQVLLQQLIAGHSEIAIGPNVSQPTQYTADALTINTIIHKHLAIERILWLLPDEDLLVQFAFPNKFQHLQHKLFQQIERTVFLRQTCFLIWPAPKEEGGYSSYGHSTIHAYRISSLLRASCL